MAFRCCFTKFKKYKEYTLIVATGLSQVPYDTVKYYYRLKNHKFFFDNFGVKFKKILELKLIKPQTQKIKAQIQKLQQKLSKWKNFTEVNQTEYYQVYVVV